MTPAPCAAWGLQRSTQVEPHPCWAQATGPVTDSPNTKQKTPKQDNNSPSREFHGGRGSKDHAVDILEDTLDSHSLTRQSSFCFLSHRPPPQLLSILPVYGKRKWPRLTCQQGQNQQPPNRVSRTDIFTLLILYIIALKHV